MKDSDKFICIIDCKRDEGRRVYTFECGQLYNVRKFPLSKFIYIECNNVEITIDSQFLGQNFRYADDYCMDFIEIDKKFEKIMYD